MTQKLKEVSALNIKPNWSVDRERLPPRKIKRSHKLIDRDKRWIIPMPGKLSEKLQGRDKGFVTRVVWGFAFHLPIAAYNNIP